MAGDRQKTAGEAAKKKVERREEQEKTAKQAVEITEQTAEPMRDDDPRSTEEKRVGVAAGTVEPAGMTETSSDSGKSSDELREEVEQAREQLAETVTELGQKVDPRPRVEEAKGRVVGGARANALPLGIAMAALTVALGIWLLRRR
jgi:hypothetical protein